MSMIHKGIFPLIKRKAARFRLSPCLLRKYDQVSMDGSSGASGCAQCAVAAELLEDERRL